MNRNTVGLVAALAMLTSSLAFAHGDAAHAPEARTYVASEVVDTPFGRQGDPKKATRTLTVDMTDNMRFTPASIDVKQGETVRFKVKNSGQVKHEFVLGTEKELKEHYQVMLKNPEMEHEEPNMITLAGGKTGEVIWQFTKAGKVDFGCLQPGHWDAGMKGAVTVAKGKAPAAKAADGHNHKH